MAKRFRRSTSSYAVNIKDANLKRASGFEIREDVALAKVFELYGSTSLAARPGYVWIKLWGRDEGPTTALSGPVTVKDGDWVKVKRNPKAPYEWQIYDIWTGGFTPKGYGLHVKHLVPPHGSNHMMPSEDDLGADPVKIYRPALQELKCIGDGTTLSVTVQGCIYIYSGARKEFPGDIVDLSSSVPGSGLIRKVLIYLNQVTNTINTIDGTAVINTEAIPVPEPDIPGDGIASAFVELENGQTAIVTSTDIFDSRDWIGNGAALDISSPTELGQLLINDDGGPVWAKPVIDESDYSIVIDESDFSIVYDG